MRTQPAASPASAAHANAPLLFPGVTAAANEDTRPTGGRFGNRGAEKTKAEIVVDFRNMPRGARHRVTADRDADVEVTAGYALQGAN